MASTTGFTYVAPLPGAPCIDYATYCEYSVSATRTACNMDNMFNTGATLLEPLIKAELGAGFFV